MRRVRSAVALCALIFATGCGTGCDELDKNGRLGNGEFQYECVGPGDAACLMLAWRHRETLLDRE